MIRILATSEQINTSLIEELRLYIDGALKKSNRGPVNISYLRDRVTFSGISYMLFEKLINDFTKSHKGVRVEYSCGPDESNAIYRIEK